MKFVTTQTEGAEMHVIDMNTTEGVAEHIASLPVENLRAIAERPLDRFNFLIVTAASAELVKRGIIAPEYRNLSQEW